MAKYFGAIGFAEQVEERQGIWVERITEHSYYGDILSTSRNLRDSGTINATPLISNRISIVADPFATNHIFDMRYIIYQGYKWKISNVQVEYPRLILTIGDIYNEEPY